MIVAVESFTSTVFLKNDNFVSANQFRNPESASYVTIMDFKGLQQDTLRTLLKLKYGVANIAFLGEPLFDLLTQDCTQNNLVLSLKGKRYTL